MLDERDELLFSEIVSTIQWISDSQTRSLSVCSLYASFPPFSIPSFYVQILYFRLPFPASQLLFMIVFYLYLITAHDLVNRLQLRPHSRFFI